MTPAAASEPDPARRSRPSVPRSSRLKRRRLIRPLFDRDRPDVHSHFSGCLRAAYRFVDGNPSDPDTRLQVGFFVGRRIGGAVVRNRVRRRLREAYRRRHPELARTLSARNDLMTLAIIFRGGADTEWTSIVRDTDAIVDRLLADPN